MEYYIYNGIYGHGQSTPLAEIVKANNIHQAMVECAHYNGIQAIVAEYGKTMTRIVAIKAFGKWNIVKGEPFHYPSGIGPDQWLDAIEKAKEKQNGIAEL